MDKAVVENIGNLVRYLLFKKGPYTSQALESMAFIRTENCHLPDPIPDLQIHCLCSGLTGTLISTADGQQQPATTTVVVAARARHIVEQLWR